MRGRRITLLVTAMFWAAGLPARGETEPAHSTWDAPNPAVQADARALIIPWGSGILFLPAMTDPDYEPPYSVYREGEVLAVQLMGHGVVLEPETYEVRWGSGDLALRNHRVVEIRRGHTTIMDADWSGLVIRAMDETRTTVGFSYEVVRLPSYETFGIGRSAEEALGEQQKTWLLPPGLYKIIPSGEDYSTIVNFATVRLLPGELAHLSLVIDDVTGNVIGAGTIALGGEGQGRWNRLYAASHANLLFDHQRGGAEGVSREDLSFSGTAELRYTFESDRYSLLVRAFAEEGLTHVQELGWRVITDRLLTRAVGVRKLRSRVGLYARLLAESKVLPGRAYFEDAQEFLKINRHGAIDEYGSSDQVSISPGGLPVTLQEGVGLNLIALKEERASLFLRTGYGFRQTINRSVYAADTPAAELLTEIGADTLLTDPGGANYYTELRSSRLYGLEESLVFEGRLGRRVLLGADVDILLPQGGGDNIINAEGTVNFRLTKSIALLYSLRYLDDRSFAEESFLEGSARLRFTHVF